MISRRDSNDVQPTVRTRLTREGFQFIFMLLFVWLAAILQNINLLVLLAGGFSAVLLIQWRLASRTLLGLRVERMLPKAPQARRSFTIALTVENTRNWLGTWLLMLHENLSPKEGRTGTVNPGHGLTLMVDRLLPKQKQMITFQCTVPKRGTYRLANTELSTRFPLGLIRGICWSGKSDNLIVQPTRGSLKEGWRDAIGIPSHGHSHPRSTIGGGDGEFFGLRQYRIGDMRRWIHWRTSARRNELVVRQFEREENQCIGLVLDLWQPKKSRSFFQEPIFNRTSNRVNGGSNGNKPGETNHSVVEAGTGITHELTEATELAIEFIATIIAHVVTNEHTFVTITILDHQPIITSRIQSSAQLNGVLDRLAIARAPVVDSLDTALRSTARNIGAKDPLIVVSTREKPSGRAASLEPSFSAKESEKPSQSINAPNVIPGGYSENSFDLVLNQRVKWINATGSQIDQLFNRG